MIARFHNILYAAIKIQISVERHTEQSHCAAGLHANARKVQQLGIFYCVPRNPFGCPCRVPDPWEKTALGTHGFFAYVSVTSMFYNINNLS
jgi:hypothetical protein